MRRHFPRWAVRPQVEAAVAGPAPALRRERGGRVDHNNKGTNFMGHNDHLTGSRR